MQIAKKSQVPIQQQMYINGLMHQVWIDFFERLANLNNEADTISVFELAQLSGELPSVATSGQLTFDVAQLKEAHDLFAKNTLNALQVIQEDISTLASAVNNLRQQVSSFENRISNLETNATETNNKLASFESRIAALEAKP